MLKFSLYVVSFLFCLYVLKSNINPLTDPSLSKTLRHSFQVDFQTKRREEPIQHGMIHPLIYSQGLSHAALHSFSIQLALANLSDKNEKKIIIVGVAHGVDVMNFLREGYRVIGFEPMKDHYNRLMKLTRRKPFDFKFHNYAVGSERTTIQLNYKNLSEEEVQVVRLDDVIDEKVSVMSIDVQGNELGVVEGAKKLIASNINVLWFEVSPCPQCITDTEKILNIIDKDFAVFDFVPIFKPNQSLKTDSAKYLFPESRPSSYSSYLNWLHDTKNKYQMRLVQTDLLAVRRELLPSVVHKLGKLGEQYCSEPDTRCILRSHLGATFGQFGLKKMSFV